MGEPQEDTESRRVNVSLVVVMVACLLPYIQLGPLSPRTEVQPWAALLAWLWVGFQMAKPGLRISSAQCLLVLFAAYFVTSAYLAESFERPIQLHRSAAFLLGAGIVLAGQYLTPATLWRALKVTLPIWLAFAAFQYISPTLYYKIVTPIVPTVDNFIGRGASSLAPEATDFGFTMVFVVVLCMITRRCLAQQGIRAARWPLAAAVACVLLSKSGTGYLGLMVVSTIYLLTHPARNPRAINRTALARSTLAALVAICAVSVVSLLPFGKIRGIDLLKMAIQDPIALTNTTTSYRLVHDAIGVFGLVDSGFWGYGAGSFPYEAAAIYYRHDLGNAFRLRGYYAESIPGSLSKGGLSAFGILPLEFGLIGVIYIVLVFGIAFRSRIPHKAAAIAVLLLAWIGSFPAAWPLFWVMIGIMMSPHFVAQGQLTKSHSGRPHSTMIDTHQRPGWTHTRRESS
jgi:hypothetical protein